MRYASLFLVLLAVGHAAADDGLPADDALPAWTKYFTPILYDRMRGEFVDWFDPPPTAARAGAERYAFFANQLRAGFKFNVPHLVVHVEGQDVRIANLPDDASLPAPYGNLGPGALYFAYTHGLDGNTSQGETSLRQGFATLADPPGVPGLSVTGGRFEYSEGLETVPEDPALAWIERNRIAERLVGPFNYTHVGRSFDGVKAVYDHPLGNVTALAVRPTHGGYEISSMRELGDIGLAGVALTAKGIPGVSKTTVARLFYFFYEDNRFADERDDDIRPVKVDNRPLAVRKADDGSIRIHTIGAHVATVADAGPGRVDALAWGAGQSGVWGKKQSDAAWAYAVEAGYQMPSWWGAPWLRFGVNQSSGDDDPNDDEHTTFFQMLPTARLYALFPFYNLMNSQDAFAQILLKPHPKVTLRSDYHYLRLTEPKDLWYAGGGAGNDDIFGFSGIPANDRRNLASVLDLTVTVAILKQLTASLYYGHAFGQGVVGKTFDGTAADYGYLELVFRY